MRTDLVVNETFYSLQGEGVRSGTPNVFVRLSGCNQTCRVETHGFDCDTEFASGTKIGVDDLIKNCEYMVPDGGAKSVVFTGGEPLLQLKEHHVSAFRDAGWFVALETNGSIKAPCEFDWICVSPKFAEHSIRQLVADEVRYVRCVGQGIPKPSCRSEYRFVSPPFFDSGVDRESLEWCIGLVMENPGWRLSIQSHKIWGVR